MADPINHTVWLHMTSNRNLNTQNLAKGYICNKGYIYFVFSWETLAKVNIHYQSVHIVNSAIDIISNHDHHNKDDLIC